jgi:hypothetical protein
MPKKCCAIWCEANQLENSLGWEQGPPTPGILYEYQNKELTKFAMRKLLKTKGTICGRREMLLSLASSRGEWACAEAHPYSGLARETRPEVAW